MWAINPALSAWLRLLVPGNLTGNRSRPALRLYVRSIRKKEATSWAAWGVGFQDDRGEPLMERPPSRDTCTPCAVPGGGGVREKLLLHNLTSTCVRSVRRTYRGTEVVGAAVGPPKYVRRLTGVVHPDWTVAFSSNEARSTRILKRRQAWYRSVAYHERLCLSGCLSVCRRGPL